MIDDNWTWDPRDEAMVPSVTGRIRRWARKFVEHDDDIVQYASTTHYADGTKIHTPEITRGMLALASRYTELRTRTSGH